MKYPRTAVLILLAFALLAPVLHFLLSLPVSFFGAYLDWRAAVEACMQSGQPTPPFNWSAAFVPIQYFTAYYVIAIPLGLACGIVPAAWAVARGYLPSSIVVVSACLIALVLSVVGSGLALNAAMLVAVSLGCLWLLRRCGVRALPPRS